MIAVNNVGSSAGKSLSLVTALPATPAALALNNGENTTAITLISKLIGNGLTYRLSATASPLANRYQWTLPDFVTRVTSKLDATEVVDNESTLPEIFVRFDAGSTVTAGSVSFGVQAVNNVGPSLLTKTLSLVAAVPAVVATITPATPLTVCNRANGYIYTITAPVGANYYEITAPVGSIVTSASNLGNDTNVLETSDLIFTVVYDAFDTIDNKLVIKSMNNVGPSATSKSLTMVYTTTCPGGRSISDAPVADEFSAVAYPNPSIEGFKVKSGNGKSFGVQVYDMLGRSIEQRQMNSDDQIGSNYASGIYNVIVNQGANVKTLRVIKQ